MVVSNRTVPNDNERTANSSPTGDITVLAVSATPALSGTEQITPIVDKSRKPRSWWLKRFAVAATAVVSGLGTAALVLVSPLPLPFSSAGNFQPNHLWSLFGQGLRYPITRPINILLMGVDRAPDEQGNDPKRHFAGRSDTILVVRIDPQSESASILSIPRDTQVQIPQVGWAKINEANADGGPALARDVVSQTLGQLPLDRYVRINTDALKELIDELGGVDVFVPKPMKYTDVTQKLYIDLQPGLQRLNGDQAEQFVRFRHDNLGDIGRVQRQQLVLRAIREKVTQPGVIPRIPGVIHVLQNYIDTNLSVDEMLALAQIGMKLDQKQIQMVMLPGRFGSAEENASSYWLMNPEGRDRILQTYFGHAVTADGVAHAAEESPSTLQSLNIAIQNASGEAGIGSLVADHLKSQGFNSVYVVEDWPQVLASSNIIVQQGDLTGAKAMQKHLGLGEVEITSTGDIESDLTLRIGKDWAKQNPVTPASVPTDALP